MPVIGFRHRHGFRQVLELLHAAQFLDDIQHFGHTLEAADRLDRLGDLLDLLQRDRAAVRRLLDDCGCCASGFSCGLASRPSSPLPPLLSLVLMLLT